MSIKVDLFFELNFGSIDWNLSLSTATGFSMSCKVSGLSGSNFRGVCLINDPLIFC
jgi:hypothetical protein